MFSVNYDGKILDVVCRRHPAGKRSEVHSKWYVVYIGDEFLGQVIPVRVGWTAICERNPELNWLGQGFATRRLAIEFMLRLAGYWSKECSIA